jgi:hypothetical protein
MDAKARTWPKPAHWGYLALRWYLIAGGVFAVIGLSIIELREKRVGLGTGVTVAVILGVIKGIFTARSRSQSAG